MLRISGLLCVAFVVVFPAGCIRNPNAATTVARDEFDKLSKKINDEFATLKNRTKATEDSITTNQQVLNNINTELGNQNAELRQLVMRDEFGRPVHRFDTNNPAARNEFGRAMKSTVPNWGTLIIHNRLSRDQYVYVNDQGYEDRFLVPANSRRPLMVRTGMVAVRLPGQEARYWTIGFPDYRFSIDIKSRRYVLDPWQQNNALGYVAPVESATGIASVN
jgi:hypothetical protein